MAKSSGLGMRLFIGGYDLSGDVGAIDNISTPRGVLEVPGIDKSAMERVLTHADASISFTSFFNKTGDAWALLSALPTAEQTVLVLKASTREASALGMTGRQINYDPSRPADGSLSISTQVQGSSGVAPGWGLMLTAGKETHASAGSTAGINNLSSTSQGLGIWAHAFSLSSGAPTLIVEDSANGSVWATLQTLTINGAREHEYIVKSGTIRQHLRITTTGSFSNFAVAVMARRFTADDLEAAA